jgi:hypothetical protein
MPQDFPTAREHPSDAGIYRLYAEDSLAAVGSRQLFSNAKGVTSILDQPWNPSSQASIGLRSGRRRCTDGSKEFSS